MRPHTSTGRSIGTVRATIVLACLFVTAANLGHGQSAAPVAAPAPASVSPSATSPMPAPPLTEAQKAMLTGKLADFVSQFVTKTGIKLVPIPAGTFLMGSPADESGRDSDEGPQTKVTITKAFWLGKYAVTQGQWKTLMGTDAVEQARRMLADDTIYNFGTPKTVRDLLGVAKDTDPKKLIGNVGEDYPIYWVSWDEATAFCRKLTEQERSAERLPTGYEYRLPTEAQWEYACRAGTTEATYAGKMEIKGEKNAPVLDAIAWYGGNSSVGYIGHGFSTTSWAEKQYPGGDAGPREVGGKQPNAWGLYDMLGNVNQWCGDWYADKLPGGDATDPAGPPSGSSRVAGGGSWDRGAAFCRSARRNYGGPGARSISVGFRVALSAVR
jgi:formylglycine-generating enzyme required for sulfatase activity